MPYGDQTGPNGMGPFTGRGMGIRRGIHYGMGRGAGLGRGYGRGYGFHRNYYYNDEERVPQKSILESELKIMKERVAELEQELKRMNG